jgi:hypothetical protein
VISTRVRFPAQTALAGLTHREAVRQGFSCQTGFGSAAALQKATTYGRVSSHDQNVESQSASYAP